LTQHWAFNPRSRSLNGLTLTATKTEASDILRSLEYYE
jgi:hypothetical protein